MLLIDRLLQSDLARLSDAELQALLVLATLEIDSPPQIAGVAALKDANLPFTQDQVLQHLLAGDLMYGIYASILNRQIAGHEALVAQMRERIGLLSSPRSIFSTRRTTPCRRATVRTWCACWSASCAAWTRT